ncbi:MAG: hypothetical protein IT294_07135 [Deltaproteobacteria bacterium]|nr:hypothetical protein [Deltaproteobacteria bacterium]
MSRPAHALLLALACAALAGPGAARERTEIQIDHLDGSGTKTIVDVQPSVPGVADFIRATPGPIPAPGELLLPATATPTRTVAPTPVPRRY